MTKLFLDLETYSRVDIKDAGAYRYSEDCEILLFAYAVDDGPVRVWDLTRHPTPPKPLLSALQDPGFTKIAHNSQFDRNVISHQLTPTPVEQWEDTMVMAYTLGLRGKLELMLLDLGASVDFQKEKDGKRLVRMFCKPQRVTKNQPHERRTRETDPEDWRKFIEYARQDVEAMRWAYNNMPQLVIGDRTEQTRRELALWRLSERINDRGMAVDAELAEKAIDLTERCVSELDKELRKITGGTVQAATQVQNIKDWTAEKGLRIDSLSKENIVALLKTDLPPDVKRVLEIRQEAGRTSTAKYATLLQSVSTDGRLRGGIQYYAAQRTGRYGGRRFQPQNLPHSAIPDSDVGAEAIIRGTVDELYDEPVEVAVSCIRSAVVAGPGKVLTVSDLSNIEGRVLPVLAGEKWKIQAFRDYDAGIGPDIYKVAYHKSFGVPIENIGKPERQIGKYQELSMQYQGGVGAFYKQARKFDTDMIDLYYQVIDRAASEQVEKAEYIVEWIRENNHELDHLSDEEIIGADIIKQLWRDAHPAIVSYWYSLEDMARFAIDNPGQAFAAGNGMIKAIVRKCFKTLDREQLLIMLPSKRVLIYHSPRLSDTGRMTYMGLYQNSWVVNDLYGGKIAENVTQAVARDIMTWNMPDIDKEMPIIGTVHDEIITETPYGDDCLDRLSAMMSRNPPWMPQIPLAADGYVAKRYRKD